MFLMITKIIVMPYMCVGLWVHKTLFLLDAYGFSQGAGEKSITVGETEASWGRVGGVMWSPQGDLAKARPLERPNASWVPHLWSCGRARY